MATGPEHYLEAERMRAEADEWMDAGLGWKANLTAQERINLRLADLADALVHATLALAAAMGTYGVAEETRTAADVNAWEYAAGEYSEQRRVERAEREAEEAEGDENHFTRAQMDGEACTECRGEFAEGEASVPSVQDFIEGQLFAHAACMESEASK